jgi:hypothetical protein
MRIELGVRVNTYQKARRALCQQTSRADSKNWRKSKRHEAEGRSVAIWSIVDTGPSVTAF